MSAPTSTPPITMPHTAPTAITAEYADNAFARAFPVKRVWMVLMICGIISAAPAPCASRATTSATAVGARPHSSELAVNASTPVRNRRRRPYSSPSRAPVTSSIA